MSNTVDHLQADQGDVVRDRAIRLFKFLRELALLKSKIVRDLSDYEKVVWLGDVPEYKGCFSLLNPDSDKLQDTVWLQIKQAPEPGKPPFPPSCGIWIEEETEEDDPHAEPRLRDEVVTGNYTQNNIPTTNTQQYTEKLSDHPEVLREFEQWKQDKWHPWVENHTRWKKIDESYFKLFSIYQQLKKLGERYELLLGLGLLTWETPNNQIIRRHIIVGDAHLSFDAYRAEFELQAAPEGVKLHLETDMIEQSYLPSLEQLKEFESLLGLTQESPWNKDDIEKILRSFINSISPHGIYSDSLHSPDKPTKEPTVTFAPAIILRTRTQRSQIQCLNNIIEKITKGDNIPSGIEILCEEPERTEDNDDGTESSNTPLIDENLYLPLPTNEEQKQIAYKIKEKNGILVQGPPGTGKSHTIANIICHLLAEGKRVLVTSQTPRALKVLKEKIPKETQALCVTLLGNDQIARQELENSVYGINQKYSDWDQLRSKNLIAELEGDLYKIKKGKAEKQSLLRELREINTYQHEVANGIYRGTAQQIAQRVASEESTFSWLEDDIKGKKECPISNAEFADLLRLYRELPEDYCNELRRDLVGREELPILSNFVKSIDDEQKARHVMLRFESRRASLRYHTLMQLPEDDLIKLHKSIADLITARGSINNRFAWIQQAILDVLVGNDTPWDSLYAFMEEHLSRLEEKVKVAQTLDVKFPEHVTRSKLKADAIDLIHHLEAGGGMGWKFLAPQVVRQNRYILNEVKVNGRFCKTSEQLSLLVTYLDAIDEVEFLWSAFQGKDKKEEGSLLLQVGYLKERLKALDEVLDLKGYMVSARECLKAVTGLSEPQWDKSEDLEEMIRDIQAVESEHSLKRATSTLEKAIQNLRIVQASPKSHALNHEIIKALEERNAKVFAQCLETLESLEKGRAALNKRDALQKRLRIAAPKLAYQLQNTFKNDAWDDRVNNFESAWSWKIADNWVREFGQEHNEFILEASLKQLTLDEQKTVSRLSATKAWDNCLRKLTAFQRANLVAWATAMRRMPKTLTAKTRPKWLKQAQECMDNCRSAIPAWIMPLYRVFETIPPAPECFDVIIIDEASQTGPEGLVLQYLAKQIIIVGDAQQISPDAIGVPQEDIEALIKRYLDGIPFKGFYHPETSLFAFAEILFSGKIVLREHFRCMPEIIQFSNQLCYSGTPLKPLRQYPPKRLEPILLRHVKDGFREGSSNNALNRPEADALVESIVETCLSKEYAGKTIGVISLQGEAQAKYIESKLLTCLSPADLETRKIVCGDAYAFQGDERDIMFLSMVAAPNERIGALNKEADKRRFNVAASRAKDQVVLFHTATLNDLHPECMRYKLLEYYLNPTRQVSEVDLDKCESQFERDVCQAIISKGYRVVPQYKVAEYRIDMVLEGFRSQLAVECDGDEWHGLEYYEKDMARQRILERCGWRFWRIRGYEYYRNPANALEPLWKLLSDMGIKPITVISGTESVVESKKHEETERVVISKETSDLQDSTVEEEPKSKSISDYVPSPEYVERVAETPAAKGPLEKSDIYNYPPQFYYKLAHVAKESNKLDPWERSLIFKIGTYRIRGWQISEKMERQAIRIMQIARQSGIIKDVEKELENNKQLNLDMENKEKSAESFQESVQWLYEEGLKRLFIAQNPIQHSGQGLELVFLSIALHEPVHNADDCRTKGLTYNSPLYIRAQLLIKRNGEIKEQDVYLADIPTITPNGTLIINGEEKALAVDFVSSLTNSPIDRSLDVLKSTVIKRMSRISNFDNIIPSKLIDATPLKSAITEFFGNLRQAR